MSRHDRRPTGYILKGGIPWPRFGDGQEYADRITAVRHTQAQEAGTLQWVEWCHPDGTRMDPAKVEAVKKATKTLPERRTTNPGAWWAVVSWARRDQVDSLPARVPLECLEPDSKAL